MTSNVTILYTKNEVISAKFLAWRAFMARLMPTGFTVKPEYQERWWGYRNDRDDITHFTNLG